MSVFQFHICLMKGRRYISIIYTEYKLLGVRVQEAETIANWQIDNCQTGRGHLCLVFVICFLLPSSVISANFCPMSGAFNAIRPQGLQKVWQSRIEPTISILCGGFLSIFLSPTHHELILKTCGRLLFACWPYSMYWIFAPSPFQLYSKYLWTYFDCCRGWAEQETENSG